MNNAIVWQGFDLGWENNPHRLNQLACFVDNLQTVEEQVTGNYTSIMQRGEYSDTGNAYIYLTRFNGQGIDFTAGSAPPIVLEGEIGTFTQQVGSPVTYRLPSGKTLATVLLSGFKIESGSDHPAGITTRGFGFQLVNLSLADGVFSFQPQCFIFPDVNPDRPKQAPSNYSYEITVYYTIITAELGTACFTLDPDDSPTVDVKYTAQYNGSPTVPLEEQNTMQGQGGTAFNQATVGVRGFGWQLRNWDDTKRDGRYLRRLVSSSEISSYCPDTGQAALLSKLLFSNASGIAYGYNAELQLFTSLIQYNGCEAISCQLQNVNEDTGDPVTHGFTV